MYDFSPVSDQAILHVRMRADYPACVEVLKDFAPESEERKIGRIDGLHYMESGGYVFRVLLNDGMEQVAMMWLAFAGLNNLKHEIEYERESIRRVLEDKFIPLPRYVPEKKSWN